MAKRSPSVPWMRWIKQSPTTLLILLLAWTLYQLAQNFDGSSSEVKLPASDSPVELYSNQTRDDLTRLFVQAVDHARESITVAIYALTDRQIIQALKKKSESGVSVYIVCDAKASPGISQQLPHATVVRRFSRGLMHQKILIVDRAQIWLGSANFTPSSLEIHGNLVVGLENPALAAALTSRIKSMDEDGGVASPLSHRETIAGSQKVELWVLPDDPEAMNRMIALFRSAQKSIKVAMFTWTRADFAQELAAAAKRGVQVSVVLDRYSGKGASAGIVRGLVKAGISVRLSTGQGLLHHKFAYIDNRLLVNGSANWTNAAFKDNDDLFVVIDPLTEEQKVKMNQLWKEIEGQSSKPNLRSKMGSKTVMNIALIGYGKMGQCVEQMALAEGHQVVARFSKEEGTAESRQNALAQADIAIDFSGSAAVLDHLRLCLALKKPLVLGTTGWEEGLGQARQWVEEEGGACLYAPNFSIGVYLFERIVAYAATLLEPFSDYDVGGVEIHHRHKADAPSGTAKALARAILERMPRLPALDFSSVRSGYAPGTHTLYFDSVVDTLTFTHQAHSRQGFAKGALMAAEWLLPRCGFFTLNDMMEDYLSRGIT